MLLWEGGLIKAELCRAGRKPCHSGPVSHVVLDEGELVTVGKDGFIRVSFISVLPLRVEICGQQVTVTYFLYQSLFMEGIYNAVTL